MLGAFQIPSVANCEVFEDVVHDYDVTGLGRATAVAAPSDLVHAKERRNHGVAVLKHVLEIVLKDSLQ